MQTEAVKQTETKTIPVKNIVAGIDIDKLVKKAQESYGKNEKGLAKQLATGTSIVRATKDSDFIIWPENSFYSELTHTKGLVMGRITQISGKADSGKSTAAAIFMAAAQKRSDTIVILWDAEKKFSAIRFRDQMGGDPDKLLIVDTNSIIQGIKAVANFVNTVKEMDPSVRILIVWDSVGASINSSEDSEENEDYSKQPGVSAKEVAFAVRKLNKLANKYRDPETGDDTICSLIVNQTYSQISGMGAGNGQVEKGGTELYYLSSVVIQLSRKQDLTRTKGGDKYKYGIVSRAKVRKNHLFDGSESISELDIVVSASGIQLAKDVKGYADIQGWDEKEED